MQFGSKSADYQVDDSMPVKRSENRLDIDIGRGRLSVPLPDAFVPRQPVLAYLARALPDL